MRATFFKELTDLAEKDKSIYLLTANLGFKLFDDFRLRCPGRFLDVGVAEADMVGIAAGLALTGKKVYCYSIIPFLVMRAFEQIRIDIALHNLNVKLIGMGAGFTYGLEGFTHFALEDLAMMRAMPNMNIAIPADQSDAKSLMHALQEFHQPVYIRLGKSHIVNHPERSGFVFGKGQVVCKGKDCLLFACGGMVSHALKAAEVLDEKGISVEVVNMHTIKPLDEELVRQKAEDFKYIMTIEEHSCVGGLGSAIADVLLNIRYQGSFKKLCIDAKPPLPVGDCDYLNNIHGLNSENIQKQILLMIESVRHGISNQVF